MSERCATMDVVVKTSTYKERRKVVAEPNKKKQSRKRYSKMRKLAKRAQSKEDPSPRLGFQERMGEWWSSAKGVLKSRIFRRTVLIGASFILMGGGFLEVQRSRSAKAYEQAMTVSPSNEPMEFALSGVSITFMPQFRSDNTYIIPFEIDGLESLSLNPEDYIVQLQGTNEMSDPSMGARFVLFGTSGQGAIVMQGEYTGEPLNIYLISTDSMLNSTGERVEVTSEEITQMQAENGNLIINQQGDGSTEEEQSTEVPTGEITVGGQPMTVAVDMVATRLNPSADNVTPTYRDVNIESSHAELYDVTFGAVDRSTTYTNMENAERERQGVVDMIEEYEVRMEDNPNISEEDTNTIKEANAIALDSMGSQEDNDEIQDLLSETEAYAEDEANQATNQANVSPEDMSEEERQAFLEEELNTENLGISQETSTLEAMDQLRTRVSDLNYQIALYETEMNYVDEVAAEQDELGRSTVRYDLLTPFE